MNQTINPKISTHPHTVLSELTCFSFTESERIAQLVLNRPEAMNTMHPTFWRELDAVLTRIQRDGTARALVISSTG